MGEMVWGREECCVHMLLDKIIYLGNTYLKHAKIDTFPQARTHHGHSHAPPYEHKCKVSTHTHTHTHTHTPQQHHMQQLHETLTFTKRMPR